MIKNEIKNEFVAVQIPFIILGEYLPIKIWIFLMYLFGCVITYYLFLELSVPFYGYIIGSFIWTIVSLFVQFSLMSSASFADFFGEAMLDKLIKDARPTNVVHRFAHAVLALAVFSVVFGMFVLIFFGYSGSDCDGARYPSC